MKKVISIPEFAEILGISKSLAYNMAKRGEIQVLRLGEKRIVVPISVVDKLIAEVEEKRAVNNNKVAVGGGSY